MTAVANPTWRELGADPHGWGVNADVQMNDATYRIEFGISRELLRFFDFLVASPHKPAPVYLRMQRNGDGILDYALSTLAFDLDPKWEIGAALLSLNRDGETRQYWYSSGNASRSVELVWDSHTPHLSRFPSESHVTVAQLRETVEQWAFGECVMPTAVDWKPAPRSCEY